MTKRAWVIVAVVVIGAFFFFGAPAVKRVIQSRAVVGDNPSEDSRGVILTPPAALLASANVQLAKTGEPRIDLDTYALARSLRSEHGSEPATVRTWVAWAVRNGAKRSRVSVFDKLTNSRNAATSGKFARQRTDARFAATNRGPTLEDIEIARAVLSASEKSDPTRGATNFFSPKAQDALFARAQAGDPAIAGRITRDAEEQRLKWLRDGLVSRGAPPGVSRQDVEFFARVA